MSEVVHQGGCHCGAVRFEFSAPRQIEVIDCNCSLCRMTGFEHWIVPGASFRLLSGSDALSEYRFNTGQAKHWFCRHCGVKSYYRPRSHPNDYSVNLRCVDPGSYTVVARRAFDGQNWETAISTLNGDNS